MGFNMKYDRTRFIAECIREALTAADVDLRRGIKSHIENLIASALNKAEARWPEFELQQHNHAPPPDLS